MLTDWQLTPFRAAVHVPSATAVIADLHLGYDAVRRSVGEAVPDFGWKLARRRLLGLLQNYVVERVVFCGDLVERGSESGAAVQLVRWLLKQRVEPVLVSGNHDAHLPPIDGMEVCHEGLLLAPRSHPLLDARRSSLYAVRHEPVRTAEPQVVGHLHPVVRLPNATGKAPCYLVHSRLMVLPAFSDDAAGLNIVGDSAWADFEIHAIVGTRVLPLGTGAEFRRRVASGRARIPR